MPKLLLALLVLSVLVSVFLTGQVVEANVKRQERQKSQKRIRRQVHQEVEFEGNIPHSH